MGQNSSSTVRRKSGVLPPNLEVLLTEPATADYSPIRPSRKPSVERLFPTGPSISEINKAIKFVEDFLPLYTQQNVNLVPLPTTPLIAIDSRPLEYASAPAEIRIKDNVLRVVETTEYHAQAGQEIARTQAKNPYKRFSFATTKDAMHFSPKKAMYQSSNNYSPEIISPQERSTAKGMGDSLHIKGSFGNAMGLQNNLNRSNRSNRSDRSNKSQQDTSRFADVGEEQYKSQYKDKDYYQLSISPKTKKMNRPLYNPHNNDENDEPVPLKRQAFPIHGSFGGDPLMNPQKQMESVSFRANTNTNTNTNSNISNASSNKEMMENSRMYKPQNELNTSKDLRSRVDEEFNRLNGPNRSVNNSNMKRNDQQQMNNYGGGPNDYYGNNPQENLYGTQTLADNLHRQHKSPNSQKNNWNMTQSIQNDNNYYPYTPLKQENFYNTQPRDQYRSIQESGRGKLNQSRNDISPRSIRGGQDTNRSMLTPDSSRANLFNQSHIAKTGPVKKQDIPVLHHKLDQQAGYGQMRKSVKAIPSPSNTNGGGSISSYAQMRQNQAQGSKGKGPLNFQNPQQMYNNQRSITPHARTTNKDPYHNPQNLSTDYHYNNNTNNDMDINPISVNLNLNELLEEADRSMSYSQTGGNNYNPKHGYHPQHHGYNNPYQSHQPTQGHSAHVIAPKNLEDTRYDDENSQFDKVNGSLVLSRYENQDIHDNSMNHSIGQFNVNDSYTQINNTSKYRNPTANYQQQHMQLSGLNNGGYNQNTNYNGNMNSNMAANMAYD